jgi:hypothetical protein
MVIAKSNIFLQINIPPVWVDRHNFCSWQASSFFPTLPTIVVKQLLLVPELEPKERMPLVRRGL